MLALLAVVAVALVALLLTAARHEHEVAVPLGVPSFGVAARIEPGHVACQGPIDLTSHVQGVTLPVATDGQPGPRLALAVRSLPGRSVLAQAEVAPGYADGSEQRAMFATVREGQTVEVCVRNQGGTPAFVYGHEEALTTSAASVDGRILTADMNIDLLRAPPRSTLELVPVMFERAAVFRPGWVGAWTFWLLAVALIVLVPFLLARALAAAERGT